MKCPKCGYQSFNHLPACKKCGRSLLDLQEKLGFDQPAFRNFSAAAEEPETETWEKESTHDPALEDSLQDFFESLEEPGEHDFPAEANTPFVFPPTDDIEPEDSLFDTPVKDFAFEEPEMEDLSCSFEEMEEELKICQESEPEEEKEDPCTLFISDDSDPVEEEPKPSLSLEDPEASSDPDQATAEDNESLSFADLNSDLGAVEEPPLEDPAKFTGSLDRETVEETHFLSFADVDEELGSLEEAPRELALDVEATPGELSRESLSRSFVTLKEIEQAMALDSVSKTRNEADPALEQEELPFAASGMQEGIFLLEEEENPQRWVLGLRFLAFLTDLALLAGIFAVFVVAGEMVRLPDRADWFRFTIDAVLQLATPYFLVLFTLCFGYFTLFHFLTGQTPGKMLWRVRVEGEAGVPLSLAQSFLRSAGGLLALLPAGLGFLSILINRRQRGWNDLLANSRVVQAVPEGK